MVGHFPIPGSKGVISSSSKIIPLFEKLQDDRYCEDNGCTIEYYVEGNHVAKRTHHRCEKARPKWK